MSVYALQQIIDKDLATAKAEGYELGYAAAQAEARKREAVPVPVPASPPAGLTIVGGPPLASRRTVGQYDLVAAVPVHEAYERLRLLVAHFGAHDTRLPMLREVSALLADLPVLASIVEG
jgi:hypothetical protein